MPQIVQFISSSISAYTPKLNLYTPYGYNYSRPNCKLCSNYSDYAYEIPGYGTVNLCSTHSTSLKNIYEWTPPVDIYQRQLIIEAESALSNASGILSIDNELLNTIRENQKVVKDIRNRFIF